MRAAGSHPLERISAALAAFGAEGQQPCSHPLPAGENEIYGHEQGLSVQFPCGRGAGGCSRWVPEQMLRIHTQPGPGSGCSAKIPSVPAVGAIPLGPEGKDSG